MEQFQNFLTTGGYSVEHWEAILWQPLVSIEGPSPLKTLKICFSVKRYFYIFLTIKSLNLIGFWIFKKRLFSNYFMVCLD